MGLSRAKRVFLSFLSMLINWQLFFSLQLMKLVETKNDNVFKVHFFMLKLFCGYF